MRRLRSPKKKTVVLTSSDDEDEAPLPRDQLKARSKRKEAETGNGEKKGLKGSPKARRTRKPAQQQSSSQTSKSPKKPERTIQSFFSAAVPKKQARQSASPEKRVQEAVEIEEDLIEDDDSFDEALTYLSRTKLDPKYPLPTRKKRKLDSLDDGGTDSSSLPRGSQIFKKPATLSNRSAPDKPSIQIDQRPWTEKYGPVNMEELAVHKKKVQDVRTWLDSVISGRDRKRLLILKGAAGAGKTTTIRLLSQDLAFNINEWKNPGAAISADDGFVSMSAQFEDFVARTGTFGVLDVSVSGASTKPQVPEISDTRKGLILVEEFPNTFSQSSSGLQSFRSAVMQYLESTTPSMDTLFSRQPASQKSITPIVMIISETLLSTSTAAADSFTAYRLLGQDVLSHAGTTLIEFNPVAQTFMTKALELVIRKEARESGRRKAPGPSVLKHLSETGDVRSAVSSLEFLCLRGDGDQDWSGKVGFTKTKRGAPDVPLSKMETESLEIITQRESTLGIFHAVGKVVYNKRELPPATDTPPPQPPTHFPQHARPKVSQVDIETLLNELGTDIQTFIAALHENYILSCQGFGSEETLEHVGGCIDALSDADLLSPDRFSPNNSRLTFRGTGGDSLRQDEFSFQAAVRGLLFNLPHPVKRITPASNAGMVKGKATGGYGTSHQMLYPNSLRLWRRKEEVEASLEVVIGKIQSGQLVASMKSGSSPAKLTGVEAWRMNRYAGVPTPSAGDTAAPKQEEDSAYSTALLGTGSSAKLEMLLETLPYMYAMQRRKQTLGGFNNSLKDLEKITKVSLNSRPFDEEEEEQDGDVGTAEQWSTDKPVDEAKGKGRRKKFGLAQKNKDITGVVKGKMQSLVLEDDDIEDD
jgi:cell cycle checkpoint protein